MKKDSQYKPRIGTKVYCIYDDDCILVEEVGYIGIKSFIIANFADIYNFDSFEWYYDDYGKTWFTSLTMAKRKLLEIAYEHGESGKNYRVFKESDTYYEVDEV